MAEALGSKTKRHQLSYSRPKNNALGKERKQSPLSDNTVKGGGGVEREGEG